MSGAILKPLQVEFGDIVAGPETRIPLGKISGLGTAPLRDVTYDNPGADGRSFGREYRSGRDLVFEGSVAVPGAQSTVWGISGELEAWFDATDYRRDPRKVTSLRFRRPGSQTRVVYGRPDRYDPEMEQAVHGFIPWSAIFRAADDRYYGDVENTIRLAVMSQSEGHIIAPDGILRSPIRTTISGSRSTLIRNAGDTGTWPVIKITGPITDPYVAILGEDGELWRLGIEGAIAYDQVALIDTRPWSREVSLNGGPLGARLTRTSVPSRALIPAGVVDVVVGGIDLTGTATFDISWRDAYQKP